MRARVFYGKMLWVRIVDCAIGTAWYADKIGTMHLVYQDFFPKQYMLVYPNAKPGLYPVIDKSNAEEVVPSFTEKLYYYLSNVNYNRILLQKVLTT